MVNTKTRNDLAALGGFRVYRGSYILIYMLQEKFKQEMVAAMKAKDEIRLRTIRGILTAFTNELVAQKRRPTEALSDEDALTVIKRAVKQRKDSIEQFRLGGRNDLADGESAELAILEQYLPKMMDREEIKTVVKKKIDELGITSKSEAGKLTGTVMKELKGMADGADVKSVIYELLA